MDFEAGTYIIYNLATDSVIDLSGADQTTLIGFPHHGLENQQWEFMSLGSGWAIRSRHTGGFLTLDMEGALDKCIPIIASGDFPMAWQVDVVEGVGAAEYIVRIQWPRGRFAVDLDGGSPVPGTRINLCPSSPAARHQLWMLRGCQIQTSEPLKKETAGRQTGIWRRVTEDNTGQDGPVISDLVIVNEGNGGATTTRITTTVTLSTAAATSNQ